MKGALEKLTKPIEVIFGFVGIVMILVVTYQVFARNVLQISQPWTDEIVKLLDVWMIYVCSSLCFLSEDLIALTLIEDSRGVLTKPPVYRGMKILQYAVALALNVMLIGQLMTIIGTQMSTGEATTVLRYPLWVMNLGMLIGSVLTVVFAVLKIADAFRNMDNVPQKKLDILDQM